MYLLLLLISLLNLQKNEFDIRGKHYVLGKYNSVYLSENDTLIKLNTSDSRVTINSYNFQLSDTIIKYGGYGFWSQRNFMYYFDMTSNEWELYPINKSENVGGSFLGQTFLNSNKVIFLGGEKVSEEDKLKRIKSDEVVEYDIKLRELKRIGTLNFDFSDKEVFYRNDSILFLYNHDRLFKIEPFNNIVHEFKRPPVINYKMNVEYDGEVFTIHQTGEYERTFLLVDDFNKDNSITSYSLFKTKTSFQETYPLFIIIPLIILLVVYGLRKRIKKEEFLNDILSVDEIQLTKKLIEKDQLFNDLLEDNYEDEISYVHNTRQLNSKLNSISLKLKTKFKSTESPIQRIKYPKDKRLIVISLSNELKGKLEDL